MCAILQNFEKGLVITRSEADACGDHSNPGASGWFGAVEAYADGSWR